MANPMRDTVKIVESCGGKVVSPPHKLGKRHVKAVEPWGVGQRLLIAIMEVPDGQYLKDVSSDMRLKDVKSSWYASTFMEISKETLDSLEAHPRSQEIFG